MSYIHILLCLIAMPLLELVSVGAAVEIWSAPPSHIQFPAGSVEVCLDSMCEAIDVHHLYLSHPYRNIASVIDSSDNQNASLIRSSDANDQPVLLWSTWGLDYKQKHQVTVTLIEQNPALGPHPGHGLKALMLDRITYTKVFEPPSPGWSWPWPLWSTLLAVAVILISISLAVACYSASEDRGGNDIHPPSERTPFAQPTWQQQQYSNYTPYSRPRSPSVYSACSSNASSARRTTSSSSKGNDSPPSYWYQPAPPSYGA